MSRFRRCVKTGTFSKTPTDQIAYRFEELLGKTYVTIDTNLAKEMTGEVEPVVFVTPKDEEQICSVLHLANEERWAVAPVGSRTHLGAGNVPERVDVVVCMGLFNRIVDYSPSDMVVCAEAGVQFCELGKTLDNERQMLPLDPVCSEQATLGGLVSISASGPMRASYGTLRDMTIGLRTVYPDGHIVKTGGKVVKNVAGYDMTKLFIGSYGTLALVSQVTFKLRPKPLYRTMVIASGKPENCLAFIRMVIHSQLVPSRVEAICETVQSWRVVIDCDENEIAGRFQTQVLRNFADKSGMVSESFYGPVEVEDFWKRYQAQLRSARSVIRFTGSPMSLIDTSEQIRKNCVEFGIEVHFSISVTCGVGRIFVMQAETNVEEKLVRTCRQFTQSGGGTAVLEKASVSLRRRVDSFGDAKGDMHLMKGIKEAIDPNRIMNPGRLLGGI